MNSENQNFNTGNGLFIPSQPNLNNQPQDVQPTTMPNQPMQNNINTQPNNFNMPQATMLQNEQPSNYQPQSNVQNMNTNNTIGINNNVQNIQSTVVPNQPEQNNLNSQMPNYGMNLNNQQGTNNNKPNNKLLFIIGGVVAAIIFVVLLLSSGKTTKLTCTNTVSENGLEMKFDATIKFKKDEVSSVDAKITIGLGEYASYKNELIESLEDEYDDDYFKITSDDKNIYVSASADKNNYLDLDVFSETTYEEIKQELEDDGFICK